MASDLLPARNIDTIIGAIAISAAVGLGVVLSGAADTSSEASDLTSIVQGLYGAYANLSYVYPSGTISSAVLINAGKVDKKLVNSTTGVINSRWNTPITLAGTAGGNPTAALTGIPSTACADLMTDTTLAPYVATIGVTGGTARTPPVDPAVAATDCGTSGTVALTVTYNPRP